MSLSLSQVAQVEFDSLVKLDYKSQGFKLRDAVTLRSGVVGNQVAFRRAGAVTANPVGFQNMINIQDPGFNPAVATLVKYAAGTGVDSVADLTVNFDTKRELSMLVAMAVGRRSDQIIINSLAAGAGRTIAAGGANMGYAKLREVLQYFEENAVPVEERYLAISGSGLRALLADDHITSRFFTSTNAVETGNLNYRELLGMNIRLIPTMSEGGLPLVGNSRTCFAWHKRAVGMAIGQDMKVEINYLPQQTTWFVNGLFYAGAVAIDPRGVFAITCDESVNP